MPIRVATFVGGFRILLILMLKGKALMSSLARFFTISFWSLVDEADNMIQSAKSAFTLAIRLELHHSTSSRVPTSMSWYTVGTWGSVQVWGTSCPCFGIKFHTCVILPEVSYALLSLYHG